MKAGPKFVLVTLADMADQEDSCFPGIELLAKLTGYGPTAVRGHIDYLIEHGFISNERRHKANGARNSDRYYLHLEKPENLVPESDATSEEPNAGIRDDLTPDSEEPNAGIRGCAPYMAFNPKLTQSNEPKDLVVKPVLDVEKMFAEAWSSWPKKNDKKDALAKFKIALRKFRGHEQDLVDVIKAHGGAHRLYTEPQFVAALAVWLNKERWDNPLPVPEAPRITNARRAFMNREEFIRRLEPQGPRESERRELTR